MDGWERNRWEEGEGGDGWMGEEQIGRKGAASQSCIATEGRSREADTSSKSLPPNFTCRLPARQRTRSRASTASRKQAPRPEALPPPSLSHTPRPSEKKGTN
eukprot:756752-Hanusia_phi.AAC.3